MFSENLIMKNIGILQVLTKEDASLEELADKVKCKEGQLSGSIKMLSEQGLIIEHDGVFSTGPETSKIEQILGLVNPWLDYFNGTFYDIAKDAAKIILENSRDEAKVEDVLLYGSTLRVPNPRDIDMVILHSGGKLREFSPYATNPRYDVNVKDVDKKFYDIESIEQQNKRYSACLILSALGYKSDKSRSVAKCIGKRIEPLGARPIKNDMERVMDKYGISSIFDIHVLHTDLLNAKSLLAKERRDEVIKACGNSNYWHTILSEGRLYDKSKHDFTLKINEVYPGNVVDLFKSK